MLRFLPTETVYEVAYRFDKRLKGEYRARDAWNILRLMFLKKPDDKLDKGFRGFRAIALLSVFSKWYTTFLVDLLHEEKKSIEWRNLHVGVERGVNCEHMQGPGDKYTAETLGMSGRRSDRLAARFLQIQHGLYGKLGREDCIRCG